MDERSVSEIKESLALVKNLKKNDGWKYLSKLMKDEILQAAYNLSNDPKMSVDEINWRRGALWASRKLVEMPDVLEIKLKNDLAFATLDETEKDKVTGASAPNNNKPR
tara:strand:- start:32633 stop:32956 length:324 start_codon:yes stop_codon:yes gene_type:complete